jgi:hypothetical protein
MAIAYDASSQGSGGSNPVSWTHTPVGTPKGVFVGITEHETLSDDVTGVTYGGVALTKVDGLTVDSGEDGTAQVWYRGSGIPTGAQTVSIALSGAAGGTVRGYCITVTAASDKNTQLAGIGSAKVDSSTMSTNPSVTITGIVGASYGFAVLFSGRDSVGLVTAGSGQTMRQQADDGNTTGHAESSTSQNASGNLTIGFTQASDDVAMVGVAIEEVSASTNYPMTAAQGSFTLTGQASLFHWGRKITAVFGSFALTGQATTFISGKLLSAAHGAFTLSGQNSIITSTRKIVMAAGGYVLSGQNVLLKIGYTIIPAVGAYILSGQSAILSFGRKITAAVGSFTLTGQPALFRAGRVITAAYGFIALNWQAFRLLKNGSATIWTALTKPTTTWTASSKPTTTWTNVDKP